MKNPTPPLMVFFSIGVSLKSVVCFEVDRLSFLLTSATTALNNEGGSIENTLHSDQLQWDGQDNGSIRERIDWNNIRYGSSSLQDARVPNPAKDATFFPLWMEGYWLAKYKFSGVKFPQGRDKINLRVAGAGLGTCLSLPNIGLNPPQHVVKFLKRNDESSYEDWAYNLPRRFEAFCTGSKVSSIQTGNPRLSPRCFVTGDGCLSEENPQLHDPSTRVCMQFAGPTRRGSVQQTIDAIMLYSNCPSTIDNTFVSDRNFVQYNIQQDLQTFYREILSLTAMDVRDATGTPQLVDGHLRIAGFLPSGDSSPSTNYYDDTLALALYDYKIILKKIDEEEAQLI